MDPLKQSIMVNQFMMVTGANESEAQKSLKTCNWQLESALSMFFQGQMLPASNIRPQMDPMFAPANTPATPPNFSDALLSFAKMSTTSGTPNTNQNMHQSRESSNPTNSPFFSSKPNFDSGR
ncbi:UBA-like domain-containing protein 2 [Paramacrobiotus metropolitanus]|uniref:UBA-like domain-containing protein 2 n=1 Tax=Paramacrobiotus metropolitanus TaxID=2943436 RepID=UPI00244612F7|nr:UBA-like domain-containing protein 2 [Paramacrobiotus metropolitanus]